MYVVGKKKVRFVAAIFADQGPASEVPWLHDTMLAALHNPGHTATSPVEGNPYTDDQPPPFLFDDFAAEGETDNDPTALPVDVPFVDCPTTTSMSIQATFYGVKIRSLLDTGAFYISCISASQLSRLNAHDFEQLTPDAVPPQFASIPGIADNGQRPLGIVKLHGL